MSERGLCAELYAGSLGNLVFGRTLSDQYPSNKAIGRFEKLRSRQVQHIQRRIAPPPLLFTREHKRTMTTIVTCVWIAVLFALHCRSLRRRRKVNVAENENRTSPDATSEFCSAPRRHTCIRWACGLSALVPYVPNRFYFHARRYTHPNDVFMYTYFHFSCTRRAGFVSALFNFA